MSGREGFQTMSKKFEKRATKLARKAEDRVIAIRRVVREYNDAVQSSSNRNPTRDLEGQREIERAVVNYNRVHKALKRLHRKAQLKGKNSGASRPGF